MEKKDRIFCKVNLEKFNQWAAFVLQLNSCRYISSQEKHRANILGKELNKLKRLSLAANSINI